MADMHANGGADGGPRGRRSLSRRGQIATAVVACAVIAGGTFAVTEAVSGGHRSSAAASTVAGGSTGQAAVLSNVLSAAAATPSTTAPAGPAGSSAGARTGPGRRVARRRSRRVLALIRRIGGEYGQFMYGTRVGPRTLAFERGTVLSVAGGDVTVRAKDGTTWTWVLASQPIIRETGKRVEPGAVTSGETVFIGGVVSGSARDAKLVVIR